ncbi:MAG: single-stranded-DNA-specific exonuclease RecJ [Candidatus Gottesmanbacteria bacterium]
MKSWNIKDEHPEKIRNVEDVLRVLLKNRGLTTKKEKDIFLHPKDPLQLEPHDVGIDAQQLKKALHRIEKAIEKKESIVVYADYDADGITAGAIMWEALYALGAHVMPYVPHRIEEGYGLSEKGIQTCITEFNPSLIITVDHGITAWQQVEYAKKLGIDVIVTDHHLPPSHIPDCLIVHTTELCGAGVSWFVAKMLLANSDTVKANDLLALAAIGTIADMVPLVESNRSITKYGLVGIGRTKRIGLRALMKESGLEDKAIVTSDISHSIAPRLNAMGRLDHAIDALRLLCTTNGERAAMLASKLGLTNKERQQLTVDTTLHALTGLAKIKDVTKRKMLMISDTSYNPGIIGLVAGKLVEEYYRPSIVIAVGEIVSKASARSIAGFNIVEFIRKAGDLLVDVGGHPMAAGFTIETKNLSALKKFFESAIDGAISDMLFTRSLIIDTELPVQLITKSLVSEIQAFAPYGLGNYEPIFVSRGLTIDQIRKIGAKLNHLKLKLKDDGKKIIDAVAFGFGNMADTLPVGTRVDVAYTIDENVWNGTTTLQLKIRDIHALSLVKDYPKL